MTSVDPERGLRIKTELDDSSLVGSVSDKTAGFPLPLCSGIGLRHPHIQEFLDNPERIKESAGWVEIHSENYLGNGGARLAALKEIAGNFTISCHGVGLSMGSAEGLNLKHLKAVKHLHDWLKPAIVSEHIAWSGQNGHYLNDLLPVPYRDDVLKTFIDNVNHAQDFYGRKILMENPSTYLEFETTAMKEWDFVERLVSATGCGLLLDVNNIHVSAYNHKFDAKIYLDNVPLNLVEEIHLAGHTMREFGDESLLIDDHAAPVADPVWELYKETLARLGAIPTLIEWDNDVPEIEVLLGESRKANDILKAVEKKRGFANV